MAYDPELGKRIHNWLEMCKFESPATFGQPGKQELVDIGLHQQGIMETLGLDLGNDSLKATPARVAKMYCEEIFIGLDYTKFPNCSTFDNPGADEMVAVRDIEVKSFCEHHFIPFIGTACCAYIPAQKLLGLSKFNRIVDFFARRPQVQERLTEQIAATLQLILETSDIAVVIKAEHLCTKMRGVQDFTSSTVTSRLMGRFREVPELRQEFLSLTRANGR